MSLSKREKELLWTVKDLDESVIDSYSDDEILEDMNMFLRLEGFRNTDRAVKLLLELDSEKLKQLESLYRIPRQLKFKDAMALMDKGLKLYKSDITRKYVYELLGNRENLVKYKHLIDFDLVVREKLYYPSTSKTALDNLVEVCYDEIKDITTRTLLDTLGVNIGDECNNLYMGILLDKIASLGNRQFKDNEIIKVLLEAITGLHYTNPDFYTKIFNYFDNNFIMDNIDIFNPIQLNYANRLTEEILEVFISKSKVWERYKLGFGYDNPIPQLSESFIYSHYEDLNMLHIYITQKSILNAYRRLSDVNIDFKSNVDLVIIYLHNPHLTEEELDWLRYEIKAVDFNELVAKTKINNTYSNCALKRLVELEEFKNGKN